MATYTTNLNLKKPAQSDKIRIADINNNMDDIDGAFGAIGNDSVATQIGDLQGALAIVATGDSHAAISAGQYVYVKSHSTLDTGLYVASTNIAQNGALSSSNLTADTSGGLNALNSNIDTIENGKLLRTVTADGVKTYSQIIQELFANIAVNYGMIILVNDVIVYRLFQVAQKEFTYIGASDTAYTQLVVRMINAQSNKFAEGVGSFGALSNYSSTVVNSGTTFKLISFK